MSSKKQRRLPKIGGNHQMMGGDGSDVYPNKVHTGYVHGDLLTSATSKPAVRPRITMPQIGNGRLIEQYIDKDMVKPRAIRGEIVATCFPQLPVRAVVQQKDQRLNKRSSASKLGFDHLPLIPPVVRKDCSIKEGGQPKRDRPTHAPLPPIECQSQSSRYRSSGLRLRRHETIIHKPNEAEMMNNLCKLPDIINAPVKRCRPKSGNEQRLPTCVLPSRQERKEREEKARRQENIKLPPITHRSESPTLVDIASKRRR